MKRIILALLIFTFTAPAIGAGTNTPWTGTANVTDASGYPVTNAAGAVIPRAINGKAIYNVDIGALMVHPTGSSFNFGF